MILRCIELFLKDICHWSITTCILLIRTCSVCVLVFNKFETLGSQYTLTIVFPQLLIYYSFGDDPIKLYTVIHNMIVFFLSLQLI